MPRRRWRLTVATSAAECRALPPAAVARVASELRRRRAVVGRRGTGLVGRRTVVLRDVTDVIDQCVRVGAAAASRRSAAGLGGRRRQGKRVYAAEKAGRLASEDRGIRGRAQTDFARRAITLSLARCVRQPGRIGRRGRRSEKPGAGPMGKDEDATGQACFWSRAARNSQKTIFTAFLWQKYEVRGGKRKASGGRGPAGKTAREG
jgi:hypothetical protein